MADTTSNLIHRWQFDDDLVDSVAGDDFTLSAGSMSYGAGALSKQGIIPNGENVSAGDLADCDFGAEDSFTASGWIGLPSATSGPVTAMFGKRADAGSGSAGWLLYQSLSVITFGVSDGANIATAGYVNSGQDTQLKHFALVVDRSSDTLYLYVDGELSNSASVSSVGSLANSEGVRSSANSLTGDMGADDLRVYDRALSANDVAALYLEGRPPKLSHQCDLSASAVSALISDGVVDFGTHSISSALNSAIFSTDTGSGADVWFSSDEAGAYPIAADIYHWDDGGSIFKAKVAAGALSAVSGGTIYLHVGSKPTGYDTDPYASTALAFIAMTDDFQDDTTNGNNYPNVIGGVTAGTVTGPDGSAPATDFDGTDDYVFASQFVGGSTDLWVGLWFLDDATTASKELLWETGGSVNGACIGLENGVVYGVQATSSTAYAVSSSYTAGQWNRVDFVVDAGTPEVRLYLNGVLVDTEACVAPSYGAGTAAIGAVYGSSTDGVFYWDSTASSSAGESPFDGRIALNYVDAVEPSAAEINLDYLLEGPTASAYWTVTDITSQPSASFDLRSDREVVLSGSDVTSWGNASGGTSPSYSNDAADRILGFPAIQFVAASSEYLRWDAVASMFSGDEPDFTAAFLIRPKTKATTGDMFSAGGASTRSQRFFVTNAPLLGSNRTDASVGTLALGTASGSFSAVQLLVVKCEGGVGSVYLLDVDADSVTSGTSSIAALDAATMIYGAVGALYNGSGAANYYEGDIARIRLYNTALGGDLTGDLTGTQLGKLKSDMLARAGGSFASRLNYFLPGLRTGITR